MHLIVLCGAKQLVEIVALLHCCVSLQVANESDNGSARAR
jgi:hypothetical protein